MYKIKFEIYRVCDINLTFTDWKTAIHIFNQFKEQLPDLGECSMNMNHMDIRFMVFEKGTLSLEPVEE